MPLTTTSLSSSDIKETERFAAVESKMRQFDYKEHGLVEVLITAQETFGYLSEELMTYVADKLQVPLSRVFGVATFYEMFTLEAVGAVNCMVCTDPVCTVAGGKEVLTEACKVTGVLKPGQSSPDGKYTVREASCLGLCDQAPAALVNKSAQVNISIDDVPAMLRGMAQQPIIRVSGGPRVLTRPIGLIEPTDLDAHREAGAFTALKKALWQMSPDDVISEVKGSGLTGRGGAGFPTGLKWELTRKAYGPEKYSVCNFDESEPGTFKDRALMEGNPYRVLEGLILSAYATGAHSGYIFIRGEYPKASEIVKEALNKLYSANLLGEHILGSDYSLDVEIRHNAGAYICGEETALFEAIEGKRGHPRIKPPYPTQAGLFGRPTTINNVETLAVVPDLILHGGEWFHQWGTNKSVGLKLFCLSGHVNQPGVVEVPLGLTVRQLVERYGGGFNGEPQALLIGGAAGGFLPGDKIDTPLTHEDLRPLEVPIGSGAIMVFNQTVDLWQVLEGLAHFFVHETCGHCAPCRLGTKQIYKLVNRINEGSGTAADVHKVEDIGQTIKRICVCGLGMTAANPALTMMHNLEGVV